jgi:hypothetical protein
VTLTITFEQARNGLVAVAEDGVGINAQRYFHPDGTACCVIGHLLWRLGGEGIRDTALRARPRDGVEANSETVKALRGRGIIDTDDATLDLLDAVQDAQDNGNDWLGVLASHGVEVPGAGERDA